MCSLTSGGCHSFGSALANHLKGSYVAGKHEPLELFDEKAKPKAYETIAITGCGLLNNGYDLIKIIANKYNCSKLSNVFIVYPPHHSGSAVSRYIINQYLTAKNFSQAAYQVTIITTGLQIDKTFSIGLPKLIPALHETDFKLAEDCYGLMYINDLILSDSESNKQFAESYLNNYFSQIANVAKTQGQLTPSIITITKNSTEQEIIEKAGKDHKVTVNFVDKLKQPDFIKIIQSIGEKAGFVSCNGAQTFIQASLMDANILFYFNKACNKILCEELSQVVPEKFKDIIQVIMGQSDKYHLLDDQKAVKEIYRFLTSSFKDSTVKFEELNSILEVDPFIQLQCIKAKTFLVPLEKMNNFLTRGLAKSSLATGMDILIKTAKYHSSIKENLLAEVNSTFSEFAKCYKDLASKYYSESSYREAEGCYNAGLKIYETYLPNAHDQIFTILSNLVIIAFKRQQHNEVIALVTKAEKIIPDLKSDSQKIIIGKIYYHKVNVQLINLNKFLKATKVDLSAVEALVIDIQKSISIISETSKEKSAAFSLKLDTLLDKFKLPSVSKLSPLIKKAT